jgi:preprotein translocase subunit SecB
MRLAQISLTNYFVSSLQLSTNSKFDPQNPTAIELEDFRIENDAEPTSENRRTWTVTLGVALTARPEKALPCELKLNMVGTVTVDQAVKDENIERLVRINGTSLVFGAARETIRAITSLTGPSRVVLLPTVTFWESKPAVLPTAAENEKPQTPQKAAAQ